MKIYIMAVILFMIWEYNYLIHYGTKGQKWGVRRYQNKDGSLTPEGREHYNVSKEDSKKYNRMYGREVSKLRKLNDKADLKKQTERQYQYSKKSKKAFSVAAGSAAAAIGTLGVPLRPNTVKNIYRKSGVSAISYNIGKDILLAPLAIIGKTALAKGIVNGIQSGVAKSRTTSKGHAKAVAKRKAQYKKMYATFKDTPYAKLLEEENKRLSNNK